MSALITAESVPVVTVRDALAELLRVAAARDVLKGHEDNVKAFLRSEADRVEADTGTAANFNAKGIGRAYVTQPTFKPQVTDPAKVEDLARKADAGRAAQSVDAAALQRDLDSGDIPTPVREALVEAGYVRDEWLIAEGWLDDLAAECVVDDDGALIHASTGEVVEGVRMAAASRPTLVFRAESGARKQMVAQLAQQVARIGEGS